ncbi:MAG: hypothetical protein WCF85_07555 [Rhodospirillaceae bacterium]
MTGPAVAEYRYSLQLSDPGVVIRTESETGATVLCRSTPHGPRCPPSDSECRKLLEAVLSAPASPAPPIDEAAALWCLDHAPPVSEKQGD